MKRNEEKDKCQLCGVECELTKHHLVPKSKGHNNKYSKIVNEEGNFIWICRSCHDYIHASFDNSYLRDNLNTIEKLKNDEKMVEYIKWKEKHPEFKGSSKMRRERKNK